MSTAVMTNRMGETSPRLKARMTGVFSLLTILTGIFAQGFVSERLVVQGDAASTATNILTHSGLWQLAYAVFLIEMACNIAMTALFYDLLKPAGRSVSLLAAFLEPLTKPSLGNTTQPCALPVNEVSPTEMQPGRRSRIGDSEWSQTR